MIKTNKLRFIVSILFCLTLITSIAFCAKKPDWISGKSNKYPKEDFILGVGLGSDLDSARSNARAEISKVFEANVSQFLEDTSSEESKKGKFSTGSKSELKTRVTTQGVLKGVDIADTWYDKKKKTYYALAVLNKKKTRISLTDQILDEEEFIKNQTALAKKSSNPVDKVRFYSNILQSFDEMEQIISKRNILGPVAMSGDLQKPSRSEVEKLKQEELESILFVVSCETQEESNVSTMISEKITNFGFKVSTKEPETKNERILVMYLKCDLGVESVDRGNPHWKFYNWSGNVEIYESSPTGKMVASVSKHGQVSDLSQETAKSKAISLAEKELANATENQIDKYFFAKEQEK